MFKDYERQMITLLQGMMSMLRKAMLETSHHCRICVLQESESNTMHSLPWWFCQENVVSF